MQQNLLQSKEELEFATISLARSTPLINSHHLQPYLFVNVEECKSIHSFQELHPQSLQTTNKWESREGNAKSILMHPKHATVNKK